MTDPRGAEQRDAGQAAGAGDLARQLAGLADEQYLYLTTTGRVSGKPRTVELWFVTDGGKLYVIPGAPEKTHWVRNLVAEPRVRLRVGGIEAAARARLLGDNEAALSEKISAIACAKYNEPEPWGTPVEITIEESSATSARDSGL